MPNTREYEPQHSYQEDLETDPDARDPFVDEATDDPTEGFGVPPDEYGDELDKLAIDEDTLASEQNYEDAREQIEDSDEDRTDASKAA